MVAWPLHPRSYLRITALLYTVLLQYIARQLALTSLAKVEAQPHLTPVGLPLGLISWQAVGTCGLVLSVVVVVDVRVFNGAFWYYYWTENVSTLISSILLCCSPEGPIVMLPTSRTCVRASRPRAETLRASTR